MHVGKSYLAFLSLMICAVGVIDSKAEVFEVNSQNEFNSAHTMSSSGDQIIWTSGTYSNILMDITQDDLIVSAEHSGEVIFNGESRVQLSASNTVFEGFQFVGGDIDQEDVINITGSNNLITQINIQGYTSYKYLRIRESSQYCSVTYCNFENRINLDDQNILSILVDENQPGYHKIQYCSFKNFDGTGNDMGIEPIRIGLSTQADRISRSLVEHCYFTQCNGDGEIISNKSSQNVFRFNTFEDNPLAELVLRHGSESIVYSNFFLNGKGGVRVREGQDHFIYNNYFFDIDDRVIYLQNEDSDPLDNINIAFNTIVSCSEVILGGNNNGVNEPTNVTFANNVITNPIENIFADPTETENWIGNISFGDLGMTLPLGIDNVDPLLEENTDGLFVLTANSPAKNAGSSGYSPLPTFIGIENIDVDIELDIMGNSRPVLNSFKDLGCSEFPQPVSMKLLVSENNTGPCYLQPDACLSDNTESCFGDFNDDGIISVVDLTILLAIFGQGCSD